MASELLTNEDRRRKLNALNFSTLNYIDAYLTSTETFPLEPVHPDELIALVSEKLIEFNTIVSNNTPQLITEMCKTFNYTIARNQANEPFEKLVMSPQTGSAKSLCAKAYVSLLKNETSLIVVSRVDVAIEYCQHINAWSGDKNYARCIYQISPQNGNHPLRVDKEALKDFRCIVMTHNMFIRVNKSNEINRFKNIEHKARDLVIIDERIKLYEQYTLHKQELENAFLNHHIEAINTYSGYKKPKETEEPNETNEKLIDALCHINVLVQAVLQSYEALKEETTHRRSNILYSSYVDSCKKEQFTIQGSWEFLVQNGVIDFLKNKKTYIRFVDYPLMPKETYAFNKQAKIKLLQFLETIRQIAYNDFFYYKDGWQESITAVIPIENHFGSSVILDATAKINMFYEVEMWESSSKTRLIKTTSTKRYDHVTIHKAAGFYQGKKAIYKAGMAKKEAKKYLFYIDKVLEGNNDTMLVITSKEFKEVLQSLTANKRIRFTHWGDHIGKNDWNDCNRVMIIGWYFFRNLEYYASFVGANSSIEHARITHATERKVRYKFKVTQLADDLVQAVNRSAIRNVIDEKGNCPHTHIYLFYGAKDEYQDVLDVFVDQFKGARLEQWKPHFYKAPTRESKTQKKINTVIQAIDCALEESSEVLLSTIVKTMSIPKSTMSRLMKHDTFSQQLLRAGIKQTMADKKSVAFEKSNIFFEIR